jgi:hypothetical protein
VNLLDTHTHTHTHTHKHTHTHTHTQGLLDIIADASSHDAVDEGEEDSSPHQFQKPGVVSGGGGGGEGGGVLGWDVYYHSEVEGGDIVPPTEDWKLGRWGASPVNILKSFIYRDLV